jgi:hypothetical protein
MAKRKLKLKKGSKNNELPIDNQLPKAYLGAILSGLPQLLGAGAGAMTGATAGMASGAGGGLGSLTGGGLSSLGAGASTMGATGAGNGLGNIDVNNQTQVSLGKFGKGLQTAGKGLSGPLGPLAQATTKSVMDLVNAITTPEKNYRNTFQNIGAHYAQGGYINNDMDLNQFANGGEINIKPSKRGTFTKAAKQRGMGVQQFASKVLANKDNYSPAMVKKANFARNAAKWKKAMGGIVEPEIFDMGGFTGNYMDAFDYMALGGIMGGGDPTLPPLKPATASDSLAVYNSAMDFEKKMKGLGYQKQGTFDMFNAYDQFINTGEFGLTNGKLKVKSPDKKLEEVKLTGTAAAKYPNKQVKDVGDFYSNKKIDDYKYNVAELLSPLGYNTDLPYQVLDERIAPQGAAKYTLNNPLNPKAEDAAIMLNYDPVAIKPYAMRTPKEQAEVERKYGKPVINVRDNVTPVVDIRPDVKKYFKTYDDLDLKQQHENIYREFLRSGTLTGPEASNLSPIQLLDMAKKWKAQSTKAYGGMIDPLMAFGGMIDPTMVMQQMMYGSYAQGGQVPQNIPVEVEGEEMYEMPNGETGEFSGPKHENGGIPIALPEGTKIYSDRLKVNGKTMAQRKDKREANISKLEKLLTKNPNDRFIKEALKRQQETAALEEQQDMATQKQANQEQQMQEMAMEEMLMGAGMQDMQEGMMAMGGMIKRADGSYSQRGLWDNIRANRGSGKKPTKEMLKQEKKIRAAEKAYGGMIKYAPGGTVPEYPNAFNQMQNPNLLGMDVFGSSSTTPSTTIPIQTIDLRSDYTPSFENPFSSTTPKPTSTTITSTEDDRDTTYTEGDRTGMMGTAVGMYGPSLMTMLNRLETPPNVNFFNTYGQDALRTQMEAEGIAGQSKDEAMRKNLMRANALRKQIANSARGVGDMRTQQLTAALTEQEGARDILGSYLQSMAGLKGQRANLQAQIDQTRMGGEYQRDLADRQDIDQFYTNLAQNLTGVSEGMQKMGRDKNIAKRNKDILSLSKYYSSYGIYADYDDKGNLVLKDQSTGKVKSDKEIQKLIEESKKEKEIENTDNSTTPVVETSKDFPALDFQTRFGSMNNKMKLNTPDYSFTKRKR